ncbi:hypothetical protein L1N82_16990 [Paenibacillus tarimensis]|nr:hypothetical protein [Paenibacillus tarimensis]
MSFGEKAEAGIGHESCLVPASSVILSFLEVEEDLWKIRPEDYPLQLRYPIYFYKYDD